MNVGSWEVSWILFGENAQHQECGLKISTGGGIAAITHNPAKKYQIFRKMIKKSTFKLLRRPGAVKIWSTFYFMNPIVLCVLCSDHSLIIFFWSNYCFICIIWDITVHLLGA